MATPSDTLCALPWTHVFADEEGKLFPCCFSHDSAVVDAKGEPFRFSVPGDVEAAWNSGFMKDIRRAMMNGERPPECATCWKVEALGGSSYRQDQTQAMIGKHSDFWQNTLEATKADGTTPVNIRFIDIRLGNRCNLRCRMCSPHSSRLLLEEFVEIERKDPEAPWIKNYLNFDWYKEKAAWEKLEPHLGNLDRLHFAGGEPLIIKEGFEFLRRIIRAGKAKDISITYNTNATRIPDEAKELWPHFRSVSLCLSLDGVGKVNEYIRHPSKWDELERNLRYLDQNAQSLGVTSINVHATIQIYNILNICDLFRYAFENFTFISPYLFMDFVQGKPYLDAQILDGRLRHLAAQRIDDFVKWLEHSELAKNRRLLEIFLCRVSAVRTYVLAGEHPEMAEEFRRATGIYDRHRKQSLGEYVPDLAPFYLASPARPNREALDCRRSNAPF